MATNWARNATDRLFPQPARRVGHSENRDRCFAIQSRSYALRRSRLAVAEDIWPDATEIAFSALAHAVAVDARDGWEMSPLRGFEPGLEDKCALDNSG